MNLGVNSPEASLAVAPEAADEAAKCGPSGSIRRVTPPPKLGFQFMGWALLAVLLLAELLMLALPYNSRVDMPLLSLRAEALQWFQRGIRPAVLTGGLAAVFFSRRVLLEELREAARRTGGKLISVRWLGVHLIFLAVLIIGSANRRDGRLTSLWAWEDWLLLWTLLAAAAFLAWCFAVLPPRFWRSWIYRSRAAVAAAGVIGIGAFAVGAASSELWAPLQRSTYMIVVTLLRLIGRTPIVDESEFLIGTPNFTVTIGPPCSGVEGIGLVLVFVTGYLWYCREELRFPRALLLVPAGVTLVWLLNPVRIAALILIGDWNPIAAVKGFHSVAGWLFFNLVIVALVWGSSRSGWLARDRYAAREMNPVVPYILPLVLLLAGSLTAPSFGKYAGTAYWCSTAAALVAASAYWSPRARSAISVESAPLILGFLAAIVWLLAARNAAIADFLLAPADLPLKSWAIAGVLAGVFATPLIEELGFRGYLLRRLVASDFTAVSRGNFTLLAFIGSSIIAGSIHRHWIAATIAAMLFALAMMRRGRLRDALAAHLTAGACLALFALI